MKARKVYTDKLLNSVCCDKLVSVIVPVYNVEKYIDRCIESILCQSYKNFELILIDDGASDISSQKCDEYAEKDDRITVVHKSNGGQSSARNVGMDTANGEFIVFADSDDYVHKDYLMIMVCMQAMTDADIVQTLVNITEEETENTADLPKAFLHRVITGKQAINSLDLKVAPYSKLYRRCILGDVRFSVWQVNEDDATYYRFAYRAKTICLADILLYHYFQSESSVMRKGGEDFPLDFIPIYKKRIDYFKKRGEKQLTEGSYFRFCLVLMLDYMSFIKNGTNKNDLDNILSLFKENYKHCNLGSIPFLYRGMLFVFHIAPKVMTRLVLLLHLR